MMCLNAFEGLRKAWNTELKKTGLKILPGDLQGPPLQIDVANDADIVSRSIFGR